MARKYYLIAFLVCIITIFAYIKFVYIPSLPPPIIINTITPTLVPTNEPTKTPELTVKYVIDGDTVILSDDTHLRLIGIDTPELNEKSNKSAECFAVKSKDFLAKLLIDKKITLEKDTSETDKYGRLLRYIYLDDVFVNLALVKAGFAQVLTVPPDVRFKDDFLKAQKEAKDQKLGLWSECYNTVE